jgi:hypothetical protein
MPSKRIARAMLAALLLGCAAARAAQVVYVYITLPTEYTDGTMIPTDGIKTVVVEWRNLQNHYPTPDGTVTLLANTYRHEIGLYCGTFIFNAYAVTQEGQRGEMGWSAPYDTGFPCPPGSPYHDKETESER